MHILELAEASLVSSRTGPDCAAKDLAGLSRAMVETLVSVDALTVPTMVENCGGVFLCFCDGALVAVWCVCGGGAFVFLRWCVFLWCFCGGAVLFLW